MITPMLMPSRAETLKRRHKSWVRARLHDDGSETEPGQTLATLTESGDEFWELLDEVLGWQVGIPTELTTPDEDFIDTAMHTITDWVRVPPECERRAFSRHERQSGPCRLSWMS